MTREFAPAFLGVVLVALIAGCAGPSSRPSMTMPAASTSDLTGTWRTWPAWSGLTRSGDTMYGDGNNPSTGADIQISFERGGRGA